MLLLLSKWILRLGGWTIANRPPALSKYVIVGGPHTSNWDFVYGIAARNVLHLPIQYLGKDALFRPPYGWFFRSLGGHPVSRTESANRVEIAARLFASKEQFILALAPEGTRSKVERLRTGFYHIAKKAGVPIVMAGIDFGLREFRFSEAFWPSDDMEADMNFIVSFFAQCQAKYPELGIGV
ncbi:MAG: 1-acyl-sn-glycerol-3-phosphate acyltransferase [Bacteroidota bacterium]